MTVCIAARTEGMLLLLSDRMLTTPDVEYEPEVGKILQLTSSIAMMYSGDASFYGEVSQALLVDVRARIAADADDWLEVRDVAGLWSKHFVQSRMRHAAATVLEPLGPDRKSFVSKVTTLDPALVERLTRAMGNFRVPGVEVIIAGVDRRHGTVIPSIWQGVDEEISCADQTAFAVIGSGARHAKSQFMLTGYGWHIKNGDALMLAYSAKRKAEVAPGVGKQTDILAIGPDLGISFWLESLLKEKLEVEYQNVVTAERNALEEGRKAISDHLTAVANQNAAATQATDGSTISTHSP